MAVQERRSANHVIACSQVVHNAHTRILSRIQIQNATSVMKGMHFLTTIINIVQLVLMDGDCRRIVGIPLKIDVCVRRF